jgi:nucleotide-binding universal stress UspA family protein
MFGTIVLAVDGSRPSDRAVDYASRVAKETGSRIVAVHVKELMGGRAAGPVHVDEDEILERIRGRVKQMSEDGIKVDLQVASTMTGGPAHVIAEVAAKESADVIITGTRGHTALTGVFLGSVAQRLLNLAVCPVLVVPDSASGRTGAAATSEVAAVN